MKYYHYWEDKERFPDGYNWYPQLGSRLVHRIVAEYVIGRKLRSKEVVHHLDLNPSNYKPSNLIILSQASHQKLHKAMQRGEVFADCAEGQKKWLVMNDMGFIDMSGIHNDDIDIDKAYDEVGGESSKVRRIA